ncbi:MULTISPECIES: DUF2283 domain-containing protein [unclassified Rhizobium]|uniref:DUF2283 domain-containing protein n=1 Tax=unclassified Rhizobium TaxID=2613769 RepID=UPI001780D4D8|nr:DUF2283 domain-containing protein [Rhizobium sp. CFBP 13644]MBD8694401.1 DUF2283 domain-containing protein [Rhizobium sp. CFBP 13717]
MKINYDVNVDAAYIKLKSEDDVHSFGFTYCCDPIEVDGQINLDFDIEGRLIGIEVLSASKKLPRYLLDAGSGMVEGTGKTEKE